MFLLATTTSSSAWGTYGMLIWIAAMFALIYFLMIRPQKKEQRRKVQMISELAMGDTILTTSGFYGIVIDITEDTVIVEFGNNKNCRIPMQKEAIVQVEKPEVQ